MSLLKLKQAILRNPRPDNGFTLIELIVVITLISLMLFVTVPRFQNTLFTNNTKKVSRWIIARVRALKEDAVVRQKHYVLHVSLDFNKIWSTHASMSEDDIQKASQNAFQLPADVTLIDVEYPDDEKVSAGQADISFYEKGYSDMATIHMENNDDEKLSFAIEPFLPEVKLYQRYKGYQE